MRIHVPFIRIATFGLTLAWFFLVIKKALSFPSFEYDTSLLVDGAFALKRCLNEGKFIECQQVYYFPLLQYLPSLLGTEIGASKEAILGALLKINLFAFLLGVVGSAITLKKLRGSAPALFFVAFALISPWSWYARTTFSEGLGAALLIGLIIALVRSSAWGVLLFSFGAGISKDTAFPFVFLLGVTSTLFLPRQMRTRKLYGVLTLGVIGAALSGLFFNFFRYGQWTNRYHFDPALFVPSLKQHSLYFMSLWVSPNGGLLFFFPLFFTLLLLSILHFGSLAGLKKIFKPRTYSESLIPFAIALIFLGLTAGFSKWYAPTGWVALGPRLIFPWIPASMLLLLLMADSKSLLRLNHLSLALLPLGIAEFASLYRPDVYTHFFSPSPLCPRPAVIQKEPEFYYHCMNHALWGSERWILSDYFIAFAKPQYWLQISLFCALLLCLWKLTKDTLNERQK